MRANTSFHPDLARWHVGEPRLDLAARFRTSPLESVAFLSDRSRRTQTFRCLQAAGDVEDQ
jgi:hypothetical protein